MKVAVFDAVLMWMMTAIVVELRRIVSALSAFNFVIGSFATARLTITWPCAPIGGPVFAVCSMRHTTRLRLAVYLKNEDLVGVYRADGDLVQLRATRHAGGRAW